MLNIRNVGTAIGALVVGAVVIGLIAFRPSGHERYVREPLAVAAEQRVTTAARNAEPARAADAEPPIAVTAEELRKEYKANEVAADEHYRGRALLVTGTIDAIKKDILDAPYLVLRTSNKFEQVHARFDKEATGSLGKLSAGGKVTVRCIGNNVVIGSPQLKDCALQ